jgi:hypothetical protein
VSTHKTDFTTEDAKSLTGVEGEESFSMAWGCSYSALIEKFATVELEKSDADYSGDSFMIVRDAGEPGFLKFGWGSCSGCDALQACDSYAEIAKLMSSLASGVVWFASDDEMRKWMTKHDWKGEWCYGDATLQAFLAEAAIKYGFECPEFGREE